MEVIRKVKAELEEKEKEARMILADIITKLEHVKKENISEVVIHLDRALSAVQRTKKDTEQRLARMAK